MRFRSTMESPYHTPPRTALEIRNVHPNSAPLHLPRQEVVKDVGTFVNESNPSTPYMHGLTGVDLYLNWVVVNALLVSIFGSVAIAALLRLFRKIWKKRRTQNPTRPRWQWLIQRHLTLAPLGKHIHSQDLKLSRKITLGTIPPRLPTLFLVLYLTSNITYCLILDYEHQTTAELLAELRGRTGALAVANLLPTTLLALRNNPLLPLLGISYNTANLTHRWCARVTIAQIATHASCWLTNAILAGGPQQIATSLRTSVSYQSGFGGACSFILIGILTFRPIRHAAYETFLLVHRGLVLLAFVGAYTHLSRAGLPQIHYIQVCVGLWAAEWLLRGLWILKYNLDFRHPRQSGIMTIKALPAGASRLTFTLSRPWIFRPGCYVHVHIPSISLWSSHPFSIAWVDTRASTSTTTISLIIRARDGMTRKIYQKASTSPKSEIQCRGFLQGPYGGNHCYTSYRQVILFAGGVGITHCLGIAFSLLQKKKNSASQIQRIHLIWSLPNEESLWVDSYLRELLALDTTGEVLRIELYITRETAGKVMDLPFPATRFTGRCDPAVIMDRAIRDGQEGAVGIGVCGPGPFADSVRAAVRGRDWAVAVDLVEEAFTY